MTRSPDDYTGQTRKINFMVPEELFQRTQKVMAGMRSEVLRCLLEKVVAAVERDGQLAAAAIIDGQFNLVPYIKDKRPNLGQSSSR